MPLIAGFGMLIHTKSRRTLLSISEKTVETQIYRTLKFLKSKVNLVLLILFLSQK